MGTRFAVKRYGGNDGRVHNHHLSLLSPQDLSVCENFNLPFDMGDAVGGGSCGGFSYFQSDKGTIVICNLTTKELKFLQPPDFLQPPHSGYLDATALGYDAESKDYKLIRIYVQLFNGEAVKDGIHSDLGSEDHFELYSFKHGSWKEIPDPDACVANTVGVYVGETGRCYWQAGLGLTYSVGGLSDSIQVLSFDFATESFDHFPLPDDTTSGEQARYELVECCGSLGALVYSETSDYVELFVWRRMSWDKLSCAFIPRVDRPLFLKDDRFLFLEARPRRADGGLSRLMVYDLDENKLEGLSIYDFPGSMYIVSYVESTNALTNSEPLTIFMTQNQPVRMGRK